MRLLPSLFKSQPDLAVEHELVVQRLQARLQALEHERHGLFSLSAQSFSGLALKFSSGLSEGGLLKLDHASANAADWLGATAASLTSEPGLVLQHLAPGVARRLQRRWRISHKRLQPFSELVCLSVRGTERWLQVQVLPDRRGDRLVWECLGLDVTALEQARRAQAKAHREQLVFLSGLNARLRTPLNAITGFVQLMQAPGQDMEMDRIRHSGQQLAEILDDVMDTAALALGDLTLAEDELNLDRWLQEMAQAWRYQAADRALVFSMSLENCEHVVHADRKRLGQVLGKLFASTIKDARPGEVAVAVSCQPQDGRLHASVSIRLSGPRARELGLAAARTLSHSDDPAALASPLAWAHRMARHLGAAVGCSVDPQGSHTLRLRVSLPLATAIRRAPEPATVQPALQILVVDDSVTNRVILKRFLESRGHTIQEADTGLVALQAVSARLPDLVFMDIDMPEMDGCEATRQIRRLGAAAAAMPICAMTGLSFDEDRTRAQQSGMNHFITKPVNFQEVQRICSLVNRSTEKAPLNV